MTPALGPLCLGIGIVLIGLAWSAMRHRHNWMRRLSDERDGCYYRSGEARSLHHGVDPHGEPIGGQPSYRIIRAVEYRDADGVSTLAASLRHAWGRRCHITQTRTRLRATMWVAPRARRRAGVRVDPDAAERAGASSVLTGDDAFDARFAVWAPPSARVTALLTASVRQAMIEDHRAGRLPLLLRDGCIATWGRRGMSRRRLAEELDFLTDIDGRIVASCDGHPSIAFSFKTTPGRYPKQQESDEDNVYWPGFHARRRDGRYWLSFIGAAHGGNEVEGEITEEDFHRLRHDPEAFHDIALRAERNKER